MRVAAVGTTNGMDDSPVLSLPVLRGLLNIFPVVAPFCCSLPPPSSSRNG